MLQMYVSSDSSDSSSDIVDNVSISTNSEEESVDCVDLYYTFFWKKSLQKNADLSNFRLRDEGIEYFSTFLLNSSITCLKLDSNCITDRSVMHLAESLKHSPVKNLSLMKNRITEEGARYLSEALTRTHINKIDLSSNPLGDRGVQHIANCLQGTSITYLSIRDNYVTDEGLIALSECLPYSQVTNLDLCNNAIAFDGAKHLAQALRHTQITHLLLARNNLKNRGVQFLAEGLKHSRVTNLNLTNNNITGKGVEHLTQILIDNPNVLLDFNRNYIRALEIKPFNDQLKHSKGGFNVTFEVFFGTTYISHQVRKNHNAICIYGSSDIGTNAAAYINQTFKDTDISELILKNEMWNDAGAQSLAQAFKNIVIQLVTVSRDQIDCTEYLIRAFKESKIFVMNIDSMTIGDIGVENLASFIKEVTVIELRLGENYIGNDGIKYLAPALKHSSIINLQIPMNIIDSVGVQCLAEVLKDTQITTLNLSLNRIGPSGAKALAEGLKHSQVTSINLQGNQIGYRGYLYLKDAIDNTNISWYNLCGNNIEEGLIKYRNTVLPIAMKVSRRHHMTKAREVCLTFQKFTSLSFFSRQIEFVIPHGKLSGLTRYIWIMTNFKINPHQVVHVIQEMCINENLFNFGVMEKIYQFIACVQHNFNTFFNNQFLALYEQLGDYYYITFTRCCEHIGLHDVVKNLLLHRMLFYVDDNHEILHPYIYVLLNKYGLILYNEQLEPNKKALIIDYYQKHLEVGGAQELIDFLKSS